jgi:hypothetical protein
MMMMIWELWTSMRMTVNLVYMPDFFQIAALYF